MLLLAILKYTPLSIAAIYTYIKLLNQKMNKLQMLLGIGFSLLIGLSANFMKDHFSAAFVPVIVIFTYVFMTIITKTDLQLSVTTTIISYGIAYIADLIGTIFGATIFWAINADIAIVSIKPLYFLVCAIFTLLIIGLPYHLKRLKKGMPFLKRKGARGIGSIISAVMLCAISIACTISQKSKVLDIVIICTMLFSVLMLVWWRAKLKDLYLERLRKAEEKRVNEELKAAKEEIERLENHNNELAKIIHKDNKLVPAMEMAVRSFLEDSENSANPEQHAKELAKRLADMSAERRGIVENYTENNKKLPKTGVLTIDSLMDYMKTKAAKNHSDFELTIGASVKFMIENVINESTLSTLLADLIDNAIIACNYANGGRILVNLAVADECYIVEVLDSGIPFEIDTLINLGKKKITTHADNGGSGIGMTTTFEILEKNSASFAVEEFEADNIYSKKLSVLFDGRHQYIIKSARYEQIAKKTEREDLILADCEI